APTEVLEEPDQPGLGLREVRVVAQARKPRHTRPPRLLRIDLPRMDVEDGGLPVVAVHPRDVGPRPPVRQQPEIAPTSTRHVRPKARGRGHWNFEDAPSRRKKRKSRCVRDAVAVVPDRKDARAIAVAGLFQNLEGPEPIA